MIGNCTFILLSFALNVEHLLWKSVLETPNEPFKRWEMILSLNNQTYRSMKGERKRGTITGGHSLHDPCFHLESLSAEMAKGAEHGTNHSVHEVSWTLLWD